MEIIAKKDSTGTDQLLVQESLTYNRSEYDTPQEDTWYCIEINAPKCTSSSAIKWWLNEAEQPQVIADLSACVSWTEFKIGLGWTTNVSYTQTAYFDEVVVANQYIGPTGGGSTPPPPPPPDGDDLVVKTYPNPYVYSETSPMTFSINAETDAVLKIYTASGKLVRRISVPAGTTQVSWDGKNDKDKVVKCGVYIYNLKDNTDKITSGKKIN